MSERNVQNAIRLAVAPHSTMFRANVGQAWTGNQIEQRGSVVIIYDARPFNVGLPKGFSDLFGPTPVVIRPEDVGRKVAVFTALEIKDVRGRLTKEQAHFLQFVKAAGGISGVARSPEEAVTIVTSFR